MKGLRARLLEQAVANRLRNIDPAVARDYYQSVIDSVASVICTVDRSLRVTGVNRRWDSFARANFGEGYGADQVLGWLYSQRSVMPGTFVADQLCL